MTWQEVVTTIVPVVGVIVPIALLIMQLRRQDQTERKRVEVEYLRQAIDVLELPIRALLDLESKANHVALKTRSDLTIDVIAEMTSVGFNERMDEFHNALLVALSFAEAASAEDLRKKLLSAMNTAEDCRPLAKAAAERAARGEVAISEESKRPASVVKAAVIARQEACRALVKRIHELYG